MSKYRFAPALVAAVLVGTPAMAQCATGAENFETVGGQGTQKLRIGISGPSVTGPGAEGQGNEIGRFWLSSDSTQGNNFAGNCPSNDARQTFGPWWQDANTGGNACNNANGSGSVCRGIRGAISGIDCDASSCPGGPLTLVVEDWDLNGSPGVGGTAYYIALQTAKDSPLNGSGRRWDFALTDDPIDGANNTGFPMTEFPSCEVITSSKLLGGDVEVTMMLPDAGPGALAVDATASALPDSSLIAGYNICTFLGTADPGRDRALWDCGPSLPYVEGTDLFEFHSTMCDQGNITLDEYVAIGLSFEGGAADVPSALVGRSCFIDCFNILADPEPVKHPAFGPNRKPRPERRGR